MVKTKEHINITLPIGMKQKSESLGINISDCSSKAIALEIERIEPIFKEIDHNIVNLVKILNSFKGISTTASCGGHKNPKEFQNEENTWFVGLDVVNDNGYITKNSWSSLGKIILSAQNCVGNPNGKIEVILWNPCDSDSNGLFSQVEIHGDNINIESFCHELTQWL